VHEIEPGVSSITTRESTGDFIDDGNFIDRSLLGSNGWIDGSTDRPTSEVDARTAVDDVRGRGRTKKRVDVDAVEKHDDDEGENHGDRGRRGR
jgi:hypothetical protein